MRTRGALLLTGLGALLAAGPAPAAEGVTLAELIRKTASYKVTDDRDFIAALRERIRAADDAGRAELEAALLAVLKDEQAALSARELAGELLREVAGSQSLAVLGELLLHERLSRTARSVLEAMPDGEAVDVLVKALPEAKGSIRLGIMDSLGRRGGAKAVEPLAGLLTAQEERVFATAAAALAAIDDPRVLGILRGVNVPAERRPAMDRALLRAAMGRLAAGEPASAAEVFRGLLAGGTEDVRAGAVHGLCRAAGVGAVPEVVGMLSGKDHRRRRAAGAALAQQGDGKLFAAVAAKMSDLPADAQVAVFEAVAGARLAEALTAAREAAKSAKDQPVRRAALLAVGRLGGAKEVALLVDIAGSGGNEAASGAAESALAALPDEAVDQALIDALPGASPEAGAVLLRAIGSRQVASAMPALMGVWRGKVESLRPVAMSSIGRIGTPRDLPLLAQIVLDSPLQEAADAYVAACKRMQSPSDGVAILAGRWEEADVDGRIRLLRAIDRLGGAEPVLRHVLEALEHKDERLYDAAVQSLVRWSGPEAVEPLLALAESKRAKPAQKILALRAAIGLIPRAKPAEDRPVLFGRALKLAQRDEERTLILGGLSHAPAWSTFEMAKQHLGSEPLKAAAQVACVQIAQRIYRQHAQDLLPVIREIAASPASEWVRRPVGRLLPAIEREVARKGPPRP